jgi:S1-C subfamily serine protease
VALAGISGGVVCDPSTGAVLGMVTSGLTVGETSLPITYALPSEVLSPFAEAISFKTEGGRIWR